MVTYTAWGFDFAFGSGITIVQLQQQGCQFVCRYLSDHLGTGKDISPAEAVDYRNGGIELVLNWETSGVMASRAQGIADAGSALAEATTLAVAAGIPAIATAPVYFSEEPANTPGAVSEALEYMRGVASVLGYARTGLYGDEDVISAYFDANIGKYGWQTYGQSAGQWDTRAQLQQYQNDVQIGPAQMDRDRATAADYGQVKWSTPVTPSLPPYPPPVQLEAHPPAVPVSLSWKPPEGVTGPVSYSVIVTGTEGSETFLSTSTSLTTATCYVPHSGTYILRLAIHEDAAHAAGVPVTIEFIV